MTFPTSDTRTLTPSTPATSLPDSVLLPSSPSPPTLSSSSLLVTPPENLDSDYFEGTVKDYIKRSIRRFRASVEAAAGPA